MELSGVAVDIEETEQLLKTGQQVSYCTNQPHNDGLPFYMINWLPTEIFAQNIAPHLLNSKVFWLYTGDKGSVEDELEELQEKFNKLNLQDEKSHDVVIEIKLPKALVSNLKQLDGLHHDLDQHPGLTYKRKKMVAKNLLKFVDYSSKPLASKCTPFLEKRLLRAALAHVLNHCNREFSMLDKQDKEEFSLPELIERFKVTFGFMSWEEKKEANGCCVIKRTPAVYQRGLLELAGGGGGDGYIVVLAAILILAVHVGPPLMAILPIPLGGRTHNMIVLTVVGVILTFLEVAGYSGFFSGCWLYNMHKIHDLDDAILLELEVERIDEVEQMPD